MLRACRRILRPGGRLAFLTIEPAPGLSDRHRREAHRRGPPGVAVSTSYPSLLRSAGFCDIVVVDATDDYRRTQQRWIDATSRHEEGIRALVGDEYDDRQRTRGETVQAIDDGLLRRTLYSATRRDRAARSRRTAAAIR